MEKVEIGPLDRWGWECPKCTMWNETEDDPSYQDTVCCEDCGAEYEPDVQG
ncbi:hypothetical protein KAR91_45405 [Candidatus Pacearchaeota archaeon]|nr:hypothetical protein [Candidatus Pacearchaeota archaeon]